MARTDRSEVDGQLARPDLLGEQLAEMDLEIRKRAKASRVIQAVEQIPGPFIASLVVAEAGDIKRPGGVALRFGVAPLGRAHHRLCGSSCCS